MRIAQQIAMIAHAGQKDKAGRPYIEHVIRVVDRVRGDTDAEAVAWCHDVIEDYPEWCDIIAHCLPLHQRIAVIALDRNHLANGFDYYANIKHNPLALKVKLADIADNADESRLALLPPATADRLRRKYAKALGALA
jgi:hypothetical protein